MSSASWRGVRLPSRPGALLTRRELKTRPHVSERIANYGIHPLPARSGLVTNEMIDRLRDAEGI